MHRRRSALAILPLVALLSLTACQGAQPTSAPTSRPTASSSPSASATPTPKPSSSAPSNGASSGSTKPAPEASGPEAPAQDPAQLPNVDTSSWIIDGTGIGPVKIGVKDSDVDAVLAGFVPFRSECSSVGWTGHTTAFRTSNNDAGIVTAVTLEEANYPADAPHTEAGVRLGDSEASVRAAYPNATYVTEEGYLPFYAVPAGSNEIRIAFDGDSVRSIRVTDPGAPAAEGC